MDNDEIEIWDILKDLKVDDESNKPIEDTGKCNKCLSDNIIVDDGQYICTNCNAIQSHMIDMTAEWRYYGSEDSRDSDPTRCGMPTNPLLPKSSLGSVIGNKMNDNKDMRKIRMYQMWNSMPYWERTLYNVFDKLYQNSSSVGIPTKVIEDAKVLYKRASEKKISRGDNKEGLIASCIYYSCLINKIPRSPKEVARIFHIDPNILTKGNSRFQGLLQMNINSSNPDDYIPRFGSKLNLDCNDIQKCKELAKTIDDLEIVSENTPTSVAAGTLYYYCLNKNIEYSKKQIAEVCEVSEVTITKCYKKLQKYESMFKV
jgi:transcription initiation factor TFIIB